MRYCIQCKEANADHHTHDENGSPIEPSHEFVDETEMVALILIPFLHMRNDYIPAKHKKWFAEAKRCLDQICGECGEWLANHPNPECKNFLPLTEKQFSEGETLILNDEFRT